MHVGVKRCTRNQLKQSGVFIDAVVFYGYDYRFMKSVSDVWRSFFALALQINLIRQQAIQHHDISFNHPESTKHQQYQRELTVIHS